MRLICSANQIVRYGVVSLGLQGLLFTLVFVLDTFTSLEKIFIFAVSYAAIYGLDYWLTMRFVFNKENSTTLIWKYLLWQCLAYVLSLTIFTLVNQHFTEALHSTFATQLLMFPLRFLVSKFCVYV